VEVVEVAVCFEVRSLAWFAKVGGEEGRTSATSASGMSMSLFAELSSELDMSDGELATLLASLSSSLLSLLLTSSSATEAEADF